MLALPLLLFFACIGISRWAAVRYDTMRRSMGRGRAPEPLSGADVARRFLAFEGLQDVEVVEYDGVVTDYFDPRRRRLFLSRAVAQGTDFSAWAVALHEAGHAAQTTDAALGDLKWRRNMIRLTRYGPVFALLAGGALMFLRLPARLALLAVLGACVIFLLLNLGSLAVEFNANARLRRFLEKHLRLQSLDLETLERCLHRVATREAGDLLRSPRYFFFSALPGAGSSRPK